jgi:two-component sensor histidine kinase
VAPRPASEPEAVGPSSRYLEHAPLPMASVEGDAHLVRSINPAFCRLIDKLESEVVGRSFCELIPDGDACLTLLDQVYRTRRSASHTASEHADHRSDALSYVMWPVIADDQTVGVMIQVIAAGSLHEQTLAMNEALLLGSLRQHELTAAAASSNVELKTEIGERKQRERDAWMLTQEIAHRIKNNLQIISAMIAKEARGTPAQYARGYEAMQARVGAIAHLYDLISQSSYDATVSLDAYLREIAKALSGSLLGSTSGIEIVVEAEALEIDPERAVPFGLLVNELGTNAVKHAFPEGVGHVTLGVRRIDDQIELTVADNGVGMETNSQEATPGTHGADYVAIFVRQLGGAMTLSRAEETGTSIIIRFPLLGRPSPLAERGPQ